VLPQQRLREMWIGVDFRCDGTGDLGRPFQHRIAHSARDGVEAVVGRADINQPPLCAIDRDALRLYRQGQRRAFWRCCGRHVAPHADEVPCAVRLARDSPYTLCLLNGGVEDPEKEAWGP